MHVPVNLHPGGCGLRDQPACWPCHPASPADSGPREGAHPWPGPGMSQPDGVFWRRDSAPHRPSADEWRNEIGLCRPATAIIKLYTLGAWDSRHAFSQFWGPEGQGPGAAGLASSGAPLLVVQMAGHLLTVSSWSSICTHTCLCPNPSSYKDPGHTGLHHHLFTDRISRHNYIPRC